MKHFSFIALILLFSAFKLTAQQSNIPSGQGLHIDFNGSVTDRSGNTMPLFIIGINSVADRNGLVNRAGKLNGCDQLGYVRIDDINPKVMSFGTGGTFSLWAKIDLNRSMDPSTGQCIVGGRHTFFSKGGDGYNTPPGLYAFTEVKNGVQTIGFASTSNSGNGYYTFTLPYTDQWHHYTFTFTTNNLKVYVDGELKRNVAFSLNFNEINNQPLYIGTLGPKSTPVFGVTFWFPFTGLMDDFRLFNRELNYEEIQSVYQYTETLNSPSIQSYFRVLDSSESSGFFPNNNDAYLLHGEYSTYPIPDGFSNASLSYYLDKKIGDNVNSTYITGSSSRISSRLYYLSEPFQCYRLKFTNNILYKVATSSPSFGDNLNIGVINSATGQSIFTKNLYDLGLTYTSYTKRLVGAFDSYSYYFVLLRSDNNTILVKLNLQGVEQSRLTINGIVPNAYDVKPDGKLVVTGSSGTAVIDYNTFSYSTFSTVGTECKWVGNNFILSNSTATYRVDEMNQFSGITSDSRKAFVFDSGDYILYNDTSVSRYNSANQLTNIFSIAGSVKSLITSSHKAIVMDDNYIKLYDFLSGNLVYQYYPGGNTNAIKLERHNNDGVLYYNQNRVYKLDNLGFLKWTKEFTGGIQEVRYQSEFDKISILLNDQGTYLVSLTPESNPCTYQPVTGLLSNYCYNANQINIATLENSTMPKPGFDSNYKVSWSRNNVNISNSESVNVSQSGLYKLTVKQGLCEKSVEKYVNVSSAYNPASPIITANFNPICAGDTTILNATGCAGTVNWSPSVLSSGKVYPTTSTNYTANCYIANSLYGNCRSAESQPLTINVITLPEVIGLAGNSPLSGTYRAEKINSTQNVIINGAIDYKTKKSIELRPGFSTAANAVFNAKIVNSCVE